MTKEEAINEINKVFTSAYANYIVTALTEGATVSDFQRRYGRAYEAGAKDGLEQEPCGDAVSRQAVDRLAQEYLRKPTKENIAFYEHFRELPPVTPQEPNTWSLDDAREDFMHDVYNELNFLSTNEEANRIIDSFDRVTSSIEQEPKWIPVTERLPEVEEDAKRFLVTVDCEGVVDNYTAIRTYFSDTNDFNDVVTAWMPLPEPYREVSE